MKLPSLAFTLLLSTSALAETWSVTEVHVQHGDLKQTATGRGDADTTIITLQHAGGFKYGEHFFFIDHLHYDSNDNGTSPGTDGTDGTELYGEW